MDPVGMVNDHTLDCFRNDRWRDSANGSQRNGGDPAVVRGGG
jgi:hypothetical protein